MATDSHLPVLDRRRFLQHASRSAVGLAFSGGVASLLAACTQDDPTIVATAGASPSLAAGSEEGAIVGDVLDYALTSDDWEGAFGFVTLRLHRAAVDGEDAYFIRTDASDDGYAAEQGLVFVPRLRALAGGELAGAAFAFDDANGDQPVVLSSEPGRDGYTPAREVHRVSWNGQARTLRSAEEIEQAGDAGELDIEALATSLIE